MAVEPMDRVDAPKVPKTTVDPFPASELMLVHGGPGECHCFPNAQACAEEK